jgi:hypothetical protein
MLVVVCCGLKGQEVGEPSDIAPGRYLRCDVLCKETNDDVVDRG